MSLLLILLTRVCIGPYISRLKCGLGLLSEVYYNNDWRELFICSFSYVYTCGALCNEYYTQLLLYVYMYSCIHQVDSSLRNVAAT